MFMENWKQLIYFFGKPFLLPCGWFIFSNTPLLLPSGQINVRIIPFEINEFSYTVLSVGIRQQVCANVCLGCSSVVEGRKHYCRFGPCSQTFARRTLVWFIRFCIENRQPIENRTLVCHIANIDWAPPSPISMQLNSCYFSNLTAVIIDITLLLTLCCRSGFLFRWIRFQLMHCELKNGGQGWPIWKSLTTGSGTPPASLWLLTLHC